MANGGPLPPWADTAAKLVTQVGVPTVFAAYLLWFVTTRVGATLETIEANEVVRTRLLEQTQHAFIASIEDQTKRFEKAIEGNIAANREMLRERRHDSP